MASYEQHDTPSSRYGLLIDVYPSRGDGKTECAAGHGLDVEAQPFDGRFEACIVSYNTRADPDDQSTFRGKKVHKPV
jgi:hypothetical protein